MSLLGLPEAFCRASGYRETLQRMGFEDDQIKMGFGVQVIDAPAPAEHDAVTVHLFVKPDAPRQGDFMITCGHVPYSWTRGTEPMGAKLMETWNKLSRDDRQKLYEQYQPLMLVVQLAEAIQQKGIEVPGLTALRAELAAAPPTVMFRKPEGPAN